MCLWAQVDCKDIVIFYFPKEPNWYLRKLSHFLLYKYYDEYLPMTVIQSIHHEIDVKAMNVLKLVSNI